MRLSEVRESIQGVQQAREDRPSISRSCACAMSNRLSPFATSSKCSSPSLSMNVTCSLQFRQSCKNTAGGRAAHSSPGFGGSIWPCRRAAVVVKLRSTVLNGALAVLQGGRMDVCGIEDTAGILKVVRGLCWHTGRQKAAAPCRTSSPPALGKGIAPGIVVRRGCREPQRCVESKDQAGLPMRMQSYGRSIELSSFTVHMNGCSECRNNLSKSIVTQLHLLPPTKAELPKRSTPTSCLSRPASRLSAGMISSRSSNLPSKQARETT
jgi:hypothetical protein